MSVSAHGEDLREGESGKDKDDGDQTGRERVMGGQGPEMKNTTLSHLAQPEGLSVYDLLGLMC